MSTNPLNKLGYLSMVIVISVFTSALLNIFSPVIAAGISQPSWWSGACNVNNNFGSYKLGSSYYGVDACGPSPGSNQGRLVHFFPGAWGEYEWQCTELVKRYLYLRYGIAPYGANGKYVVSNYPGSELSKTTNNGTEIPSPGDVLSISYSDVDMVGHAAIVTAVSVNSSGNGTITILEQNGGADSNGSRTIPVTNKIIDGNVTGWLHDPAGISQEKEGTTATVTLNGQVQSFYYDATKGNLRHAWTDANGWHFEQLDGDAGSVSGYTGDVGKYVSARAVGNQLQVFYYDTTKGNLRHAWTDANGWHFESLDGDAGSVSHHTADVGQDILVLQGSPNLQLFYYDATVGDLRHAWSDASGWHFEQLDGSGGSVSERSADSGRHTSGLYQSGDIQLFYYEMTTGNLRHAWSDTSGWRFENLDGDTGSVSQTAGDVGKYTSAVFVGSYMQLFYYDSNNKNLRHAWNDSNGWHFENLDGDSGSVAGHNADVGGYARVGNSNGYLQLFYYDKTNSNLRHAWTNSSGWHFENLDGDAGSNAHFTANTGMYANLTVMGQYVRLFYYDATNTNVRHAWTDENGWRFETFDGSTSSVAGYAADVW